MRLYLQSAKVDGELAQLARALAWHARGRRFDPDILHKKALMHNQCLFYFMTLIKRAAADNATTAL